MNFTEQNREAWQEAFGVHQRSYKTALEDRLLDPDDSFPDEFTDTCDLLPVTAGALTWFPDLSIFFRNASMVLRPGGSLLIHEIHPYTNMIAASDEPAFDKQNPEKIVYSYFKSEPWVENNGADYVGGTQYKSKTFYSYSHTISAIITAIAMNGFVIEEMHEYSTDISNSFELASNNRLPLSYLLIARNG